jgi:hypothetical protein
MPRIAPLALAIIFAAIECRSATELTGVIQDPTAAALPGAQVTLMPQTMKLAGAVEHDSRTVKTDASGVFSFPTVPASEYQITVEIMGFKKEIHTHVKIPAEGVVSLPPFVLSLNDSACGAYHPSFRRRLLSTVKAFFVSRHHKMPSSASDYGVLSSCCLAQTRRGFSSNDF